MTADKPVTIRQATPEDATTIHTMVQGLEQALELTGQARGTVDDFLEFGFGENAYFNALIAEREAGAVAMCTYFSVFSTWSGKPGIFVLDLYVAENERGSGVGEMLLARLANMGRKRGAGFLRLSVDNHNVRGQAFYRRLGFSPMDEECSYQINTDSFNTLADKNGDIRS